MGANHHPTNSFNRNITRKLISKNNQKNDNKAVQTSNKALKNKYNKYKRKIKVKSKYGKMTLSTAMHGTNGIAKYFLLFISCVPFVKMNKFD